MSLFSTPRAKLKRCSATTHMIGCRKARPKCKRRRKESENRRVCHCGAYWFPHRHTSGACGSHSYWAKQQAESERLHGKPRHFDEVPF